jgi:hypothetical protein
VEGGIDWSVVEYIKLASLKVKAPFSADAVILTVIVVDFTVFE